MNKRYLAVICAAALAMSMAAGCSSNSSSSDTEVTETALDYDNGEQTETSAAEAGEDSTEDETQSDADSDSSDETDSETEEEAEALVNEKGQTLYTSTDDIMTNLEESQSFTYVSIDPDYHQAMLVADSVYDNGDGCVAAIAAEVYGYDSQGDIVDYGSVTSDDTTYPLAVKDGYLYVATNHSVTKYCIDEENSELANKEEASAVYASDGTPTYYLTKDGEEAGSGNEVSDDSELQRLYDEYSEADVVSFTTMSNTALAE